MTGSQLTYWANLERERANKEAERIRLQELAHEKAKLAWDQNRFNQQLNFDEWRTRYNQFPTIYEIKDNADALLGTSGRTVADSAKPLVTGAVNWVNDSLYGLGMNPEKSVFQNIWEGLTWGFDKKVQTIQDVLSNVTSYLFTGKPYVERNYKR